MLLAILIHASPILIHALPILIHWLGFRLSAPYPNTLNRHDSSRQPRTHQNRRQPIRIEYYVARVVSQSKSRTLGSRQPIRIEYSVTRVVNQSESSTLGSRQPFRIDYYVTRVVSQSEASITSHESCRLGWKNLLGSRLESPRYSLS